ncbi:anthrone oxygenase family protein [Nocardiopsis potens]|uniref:anthrone oxygenase family protein n=1 Tax=Nocardiopsis potens TaxID=1246458 RepID=UPI000345009C|nr:anthrone oxygenase family protein [Nocardiopsis potens]
MPDLLRTAAGAAALIAAGLNAGLFFAFTTAVMPGLGGASDTAFIDVMQRINRRILNGRFFAVFFGAPVLALIWAVAATGSGAAVAVPAWAAFVLLAGHFLITAAVNVPMNDALEAAGPADRSADPARVRARFEGPWNRWNRIRTVLSAAALACTATGVALL